MNTESFFTNEMIEQMRIRPPSLSPTQMRNLGVDSKEPKFADKLEELRGVPPFIVIGKCAKTIEFVQNNFKKQKMMKKIHYVMSLGIYQQLFKDNRSGAKILEPSKTKFRNLYRPYEGQNLDNKTLLIWRTGGIGDLCFIQPNLIHLKEKYPTCKIWFACGPQYQSMVETWDCVDRLIDLPFPLSNLHKADYHALFEGVIERCKEAHTENAYNLFSKWLGLDLPDEKLTPKNLPKPDLVNEAIGTLTDWNVAPNDFILLQIRASSPIRSPRPDFWRKVVNSLTGNGHKVVITDASHKKEMIESFIGQLDRQDQVFNYAQFSETLDYTIALTSLSKMVVGTDSALMHLAASMDIPGLGIFGPFPGHIRLATYKNVDWVDCKAECAPCFIHGSLPCPKSKNNHSICYDNIDMNEFLYKTERLLNGQNNDNSAQQASNH